MKLSVMFLNWKVILVQGILLIALSGIIFNNPHAVMAVLAFYFGAIVILAGLIGVIAYFSNPREERDTVFLLVSALILINGAMMFSNMFVTIKATTVLFGLLVTTVGLVLLSGSWKNRKQSSLWWLTALLGAGALITGINSIFDIYEGSENISNLIGIAALLSGIGLVFLAFLKKKFVTVVKSKLEDASEPAS